MHAPIPAPWKPLVTAMIASLLWPHAGCETVGELPAKPPAASPCGTPNASAPPEGESSAASDETASNHRCSRPHGAAPFCGDGVVAPNEACDPSAKGWNEWTCSRDCRVQTAYAPCNPLDENASDCDGLCYGGVCWPDGCSVDSDCPQPPEASSMTAVCTPAGLCIGRCDSGQNEDCAPGLLCAHTESHRVCLPCGTTAEGECSPGLTCNTSESPYGLCE